MLYGSNFDDSYKPYLITKNRLLQQVKMSEALIIYHHSIYWEEGAVILNMARCKIFLRYHNITPALFSKRYSAFFSKLLQRGRDQTKEYIASGKICHYIADSTYNATELIEYGVPQAKISILAPFHKIDEFERTRLNLDILEELLDGTINLLSVGRIVPNKGFHHAITIIEQYLRYYGDSIRLNIIGGTDPHFQGYVDELAELVSHNHLGNYVHFRGKVSFADLHTYYAASHVFLLLSEHEGFCLPILEAQYHKLPIIALDRCAVKNTLGTEQLLIADINNAFLASAIHMLTHDNDIRNYLAGHGFNNYLRYRTDILSKRLAGILHDNN